MIKIKKIIFFLSLILLSSCGFEPMYSKKTVNQNFNFTINNIDFSGNRDVNQNLKNNLKNFLNNETKLIKLDLGINSTKEKITTSKNKQGNAEKYSLKIIINLAVFKDEIYISGISFNEDYEYKNQSNKFNLSQYEKTIEKNLISAITDDIIIYLYSLQYDN